MSHAIKIKPSTIISGLTLMFVACAPAPKAVTSARKEAASFKATLAPPPPKNQLNPKGFGLEDEVPASANTPQNMIPDDAKTNGDGGYWYKPDDSSSDIAGSNVLQYYEKAPNGQYVPTEWFGNYGTPVNGVFPSNPSATDKFTAVTYTGQGALNMERQFVGQKNANGTWTNGQIVDASGKPYTITQGGQSIQSDGFVYKNPNGLSQFNWIATNNQKSADARTFQTNGWSINDGFNQGMTYYNQNGQAVPYIPPTPFPQGVNGPANSGLANFLSQLFR